MQRSVKKDRFPITLIIDWCWHFDEYLFWGFSRYVCCYVRNWCSQLSVALMSLECMGADLELLLQPPQC